MSNNRINIEIIGRSNVIIRLTNTLQIFGVDDTRQFIGISFRLKIMLTLRNI